MVTPLWLSPVFPQVCLSHDRHLHRHRLTPGGLSSRQAWGWHPHPGMASHGRGRHQNRQISAHHVQRLNVTGFSLSFSVVWQTGLPVCVGLRWFFAFFCLDFGVFLWCSAPQLRERDWGTPLEAAIYSNGGMLTNHQSNNWNTAKVSRLIYSSFW